MPMYNLIGYSDNYSKATGILLQYCRDEQAINASNGNIINLNADNATTDSFKINEKTTRKTGTDGTKNVEIMVQLKYFSKFLGTIN